MDDNILRNGSGKLTNEFLDKDSSNGVHIGSNDFSLINSQKKGFIANYLTTLSPD